MGLETRANRLWSEGAVGLEADGIFCLPAMPWCRHSRGDGLGFAAGDRQAGCNKRLSSKVLMAAVNPVVVVSGVATVSRLTQKLATERNALVAQLAHKIVVAHASPAGSLAAQLHQWRLDGRQVELL